MKVTKCPICDCDDMGDHWGGPGRVLKQYCNNCGWYGPARTPEQQEIKTTKKVSTGHGWCYEMYDRYGHALVYSRSYATEEETERELLDDLEYHRNREEGPCTGLIFPPFVEAEAKVYT